MNRYKARIGFIIVRDVLTTQDLVYCNFSEKLIAKQLDDYIEYSNERMNILLSIYDDKGQGIFEDDAHEICEELFEEQREELSKEEAALKVLGACKNKFCNLLGKALRFCDKLSLEDLDWEMSMYDLEFDNKECLDIFQKAFRAQRSDENAS